METVTKQFPPHTSSCLDFNRSAQNKKGKQHHICHTFWGKRIINYHWAHTLNAKAWDESDMSHFDPEPQSSHPNLPHSCWGYFWVCRARLAFYIQLQENPCFCWCASALLLLRLWEYKRSCCLTTEVPRQKQKVCLCYFCLYLFYFLPILCGPLPKKWINKLPIMCHW